MSPRRYLPSTKFVTIVGSLALSAGLVVLAQHVTAQRPNALGPDTTGPSTQAADWKAALEDTVAQSGVAALTPADPQTVSTLLDQSQSTNLTTQVGRSLLINLSSYTSQGLGQDSPTQDQLIAQAAAQINASASSTRYSTGDLTIVDPSKTTLKAYGNATITVLNEHPEANAQATYLAIGQASDAQNAAPLGALAPIRQGYAAIARDLLATPVPQTIAPLHLQLVNDYQAMADSYPDMATLISDPLRGVAAVQRYASAQDEAQRVLTSIAQTLNKDGILFTKDEPGSTWNAFL